MLPLGCCRVVLADHDVVLEDKSEHQALPCRFPFVVLQKSPSEWFLLRVVGRSLRMIKDDSVLCFREPIQVLGTRASDWEGWLAAKHPIELAGPPTKECANDAHGHLRIHIPAKAKESHEGEPAGLSGSDPFLGALAAPPIPLLSLSIHLLHVKPPLESSATGDELENQPLLLSCLKRQLVGTPLAWSSSGSDNNKSRLAVEDVLDRTWVFEVHSATALRKFDHGTLAGRDLRLGVIFPSTRITIHFNLFQNDETEPEQSPTIPTQSVSSRAHRYLMDTIRCLQMTEYAMSEMNVPRSFLFSGPPGSGKTYTIRLVEKTFKKDLTIFSIKGSELLGAAGHPAQAATALKKEFLSAVHKSRAPGVSLIFLDEGDALLTVEPVAAMLGHLLDCMSENWRRMILVAATNRVDSIPAYLRRPGRFDREFVFTPPDAVEREALLKSMLGDFEFGPDMKNVGAYGILQEVAVLTVGYVPADLAALVREAVLMCVSEEALLLDSEIDLNATKNNRSINDYLKLAMEHVGASALRDAALFAPPTTTWDDIAGDAGGAKTTLRQAIEWPRTKSHAYRALGLTTPRGVLLHGPPGCAKTTLARAAAGSSGVAFLSLSPADVYASSYVGEAEAIVRRSFCLARSAAPCVLFFDELDAILGSHGDTEFQHAMSRGSAAEARVLSTFLNEMDGVDGSWKDGVLVLGATNRPWTLDAALLRPGRFDKIIYVPPPDFDGRRSILRMQCDKWEMSKVDPVNVEVLAHESVTGNMTGAEIKGACQEAAMHVLRDSLSNQGGADSFNNMQMRHALLEEALANVRPLLSNPQIMAEFRSFEDSRNSGA